MKRLLKRAERIGSLGEVPISAVILDNNGLCIGHGCNQREGQHDPLGHAELVALKQASFLTHSFSRFFELSFVMLSSLS